MQHPHIGLETSGSPLSLLALFLAFSRVTWSSFGGALFWLQRELVERRRWLSEAEFVELLALTQLLPGPGGLNLVVLVGHRAAGWPGVAAAGLGFLGWPFLLVLGLGVLYQQYGELPLVRQALAERLPARHARVLGHPAVRRGLTPLTIRLVLASGGGMAGTVNHDWRGYALTQSTPSRALHALPPLVAHRRRGTAGPDGPYPVRGDVDSHSVRSCSLRRVAWPLCAQSRCLGESNLARLSRRSDRGTGDLVYVHKSIYDVHRR